MELKQLGFAQGVDDLLDETYVRSATAGDKYALFVMDVTTGKWSVKFKGVSFLTVSFDEPGVVVGVAVDSKGAYAYRADMSGNSIDVLGRLPTLLSGPYGLPQGDYDYDPEENVLYWATSKGSKTGWIAIDLDKKSIAFKEASPWTNMTVVDGKPVGYNVPRDYSYPQGISAYDPANHKAYLPAWESRHEEVDPFGIVVMKYEAGRFKFDKFIEVGGDDQSISNITFDDASGKFFGERYLGSNHMEIVAIDLSGDVFTLGTASGNAYAGDDGEDFYMGLGGNDVVFGDLGDDELEGGIGNDAVRGGSGDDLLVGQEGNDKAVGGAGADTVAGGAGRDTLTGGDGNDRFDFNDISETAVGRARDHILDFERGADRIDLKTIDAVAGSGNQSFTWIGGAGFHRVKGELRFQDSGDDVIVQGDTTGDGKADFDILVASVSKLDKGDFIL